MSTNINKIVNLQLNIKEYEKALEISQKKAADFNKKLNEQSLKENIKNATERLKVEKDTADKLAKYRQLLTAKDRGTTSIKQITDGINKELNLMKTKLGVNVNTKYIKGLGENLQKSITGEGLSALEEELLKAEDALQNKRISDAFKYSKKCKDLSDKLKLEKLKDISDISKKELDNIKNEFENSRVYKLKNEGLSKKSLNPISLLNGAFDDEIRKANKNNDFAAEQSLTKQQFIFNTVINALTAAANAVKNALTEGAKAVQSSMSTSLITNSSSREQQMKYGLSDSSNYALTQTMKMLGMSSDEDLMYMNSAQKEKFAEYMEKYSSWYDKMSSSGVLESVQELQLEFSMFKQEISMKFLEWIASHKETIISVLDYAMEAMEYAIEALDGIFSTLETIHSAISIDSAGMTSSLLSSGNIYNLSLSQNNNASTNISSQSELNSYMSSNTVDLFRQAASAIKSF